jgi:hypothetical protein
MRIISYRALFLLCFALSNSYAQHATSDSLESHHSHGDHLSTHAAHQNHIAVFGGATTQLEKEGTHATVGADYLRILHPSGNWAISIFGEAIFAEHTEWLFGLPVYYRIYKRFFLRTGPGIEIIQESEHGHGRESKSKAEFLFRVGSGVGIPAGSFLITPTLDLDFVRSNTSLVWGINIGKGF